MLSAGFGTRLRPVTDSIPKPLLPVRGTPVGAITLERLRRAGCEAVALNLHYLADEVRRGFGDEYRGMPLVYSHEEEILGTLGALAPLASFFDGCDEVILVNGDSLCRWPLRRLLRRHRRTGAAATLLVSSAADPAEYGGGIAVEKDGRVRTFRQREDPDGVKRRVFLGAHVLSAELLARAPEEFSHIVHDLYEPLIEEGRTIQTVATGRRWHDLGTPRRYRDAAIAGGVAPPPLRWLRRTWTAPDAEVHFSVGLHRTVVETGCKVGANVRLRDSLLLPGARIGDGSRLDGCVVGPGAVLPPETRVRDRMVCRRTAAGTVPEGSSIVGDLLYAPLDPQGRSGG